jgi:hypothetical protein
MALLHAPPQHAVAGVLYECGRRAQFFAARVVMRRVRLADELDAATADGPGEGGPRGRGPRHMFGRPWLGSARAARAIHGCGGFRD